VQSKASFEKESFVFFGASREIVETTSSKKRGVLMSEENKFSESLATN